MGAGETPAVLPFPSVMSGGACSAHPVSTVTSVPTAGLLSPLSLLCPHGGGAVLTSLQGHRGLSLGLWCARKSPTCLLLGCQLADLGTHACVWGQTCVHVGMDACAGGSTTPGLRHTVTPLGLAFSLLLEGDEPAGPGWRARRDLGPQRGWRGAGRGLSVGVHPTLLILQVLVGCWGVIGAAAGAVGGARRRGPEGVQGGLFCRPQLRCRVRGSQRGRRFVLPGSARKPWSGRRPGVG